MKILILLMLVLSTITGVPTNLGFVSLYGMEFDGPISIFKSGNYNSSMVILWTLLILSHVALASLVFLTTKLYFKTILIWIPLTFIIVFIVSDFWSFFLLIPFIIVWIVALVKQGRKSSLALK